jgi:hypothetical protein
MSDDEAKETLELIEKLVWGHAIATKEAGGLRIGRRLDLERP